MIVLVAALAAMVVAKAGDEFQYLYWQVAPENVSDKVGTYDAAMFYALTGGGKTELSRAERPDGVETSPWASGRIMTDLTGYGEGAEFLIELAAWDGDEWSAAGTTPTFTYAQLASYLTSVKDGSQIPTQGVLAPSFAAVPEPTSGLLMLLGLAGLALRRKRA